MLLLNSAFELEKLELTDDDSSVNFSSNSALELEKLVLTDEDSSEIDSSIWDREELVSI